MIRCTSVQVSEVEQIYRQYLSGMKGILESHQETMAIGRAGLSDEEREERRIELMAGRASFRRYKPMADELRARIQGQLSKWTKKQKRAVEDLILSNFMEAWR